jgi:hypothetical protein
VQLIIFKNAVSSLVAFVYFYFSRCVRVRFLGNAGKDHRVILNILDKASNFDVFFFNFFYFFIQHYQSLAITFNVTSSTDESDISQ